jgi:Glycosyltransferase 61
MNFSPYKLARMLLPTPVEAWLGNRNKVKRATLDPLLFRFTSHPQEERLLYEKRPTLHVPEAALENNPFIPAHIAQSYRQWYRCEQVQQIVRVRGEVLIEPLTGWPMGAGNALYASLFPSGLSPFLPVPPYQAIWRKQPLQRLGKVISLRNANEGGYSHFYTDLMAQLALLQRAGINLGEYSLVVAKKVAESAYGRFLLAQVPLFQQVAQRVVQDEQFIACEEAIFINAFGNSTNSEVFHEVVAQAKAAHPITAPRGERRVFLMRGKHRRRTMSNVDTILEIVKAKGFEAVDTDTLSVPEQIETFAHCRHLVGIHGAGLMNMLYRHPEHLSLFEIAEPMVRKAHSLNGQYHNLAVALGFDYGATMGQAANAHDHSFYLPPDQFEADFGAFWARYAG